MFRIDSGFVVQFGISNDTTLNGQWEKNKVPDEKVIIPNKINTISFARGGAETRSTQIFINLIDNSPYLDTLNMAKVKGFPVVARVTSGMPVISLFYAGYGGKPASHQDSIYHLGNSYLKRVYPKLDYIKRVVIIKK